MFIDVNSWPRVADGVGYLSCLWLLCAALLLPAADSLAGKRAYGEDFVRVGQRWTDAGPPPALSRETPPPGSDGGFLRQIEQLQDREGPYSDSLAEPLAGLGRYYRSAGDLDGALRSYRRALHVVRINDGLYSERQIPILQELLDTYRGSGDLQALDQRYDYYFRLYGNGQPPYSEVRLRATLGYLRWQREAIRLGMDGERHRRLLALYHMNDTLIQATGQDPAVSRQQHREVVLSQLRNLYLLEDRIAPRLEKIGVAESAPSFGGEWEQGDFDRKRLETLQRGALSRGAGLLRDLIDRSGADTPTEELARLHLELGDWYQWHGSASAKEQYARVVALLSAAGRDELLEQWLGQPVELPDNGAFWQPPLATGAERRVVIETSYDVSATGRISNLQASVAAPEDDGLATRLKRYLKQIRFRPRWVNGSAEEVAGVRREYEMFD